MRLADAQRLLDLLLLVDVERNAAEMMRAAVLGADQPCAQPNPAPRGRPRCDREGDVEPRAGFRRICNRPPQALAIERVEQRQEIFVADSALAGGAEQLSGVFRPRDFPVKQVQIPDSDPGSFDAETEPEIPHRVVRLWLDGVGQAGAFAVGLPRVPTQPRRTRTA